MTHCTVLSTLCSIPNQAATRCINIRLYEDIVGNLITSRLQQNKNNFFSQFQGRKQKFVCAYFDEDEKRK